MKRTLLLAALVGLLAGAPIALPQGSACATVESCSMTRDQGQPSSAPASVRGPESGLASCLPVPTLDCCRGAEKQPLQSPPLARPGGKLTVAVVGPVPMPAPAAPQVGVTQRARGRGDGPPLYTLQAALLL